MTKARSRRRYAQSGYLPFFGADAFVAADPSYEADYETISPVVLGSPRYIPTVSKIAAFGPLRTFGSISQPAFMPEDRPEISSDPLSVGA